jgi:Asp-tRNA(Asn)/Glu-tRNA(Gln) amidotransferase A subunit family amidase
MSTPPLGQAYDRRAFMATFAGLGLGGTLLPGVLWASAAGGAEITVETIACAEEIAGVTLEPEQREMILQDLRSSGSRSRRCTPCIFPTRCRRRWSSPLLQQGATSAAKPGAGRQRMVRSRVAVRERPGSVEDLAFAPVTVLSELLRRRRVTSTELTRMYLDRIRRYDPTLLAVVTVTEERALRQARAADEEIARGRYRGPLHGVPWGAKDLLAVRGYPTTWGVAVYRDRVIDEDAVVQRLDAAGAVLVAKLTLGELAWGDVWFGGMTRNPWRTEQGSSGSSAGAGSATAAGLVGFAIGSETLGSISSPATRNGVTGLRPTFGRVPRTGAMALSWTMDKLGPMCRSAEDCALVLDAIHGADGRDPPPFISRSAGTRACARTSCASATSAAPSSATRRSTRTARSISAALDVLRSQGATLVPVDLPEVPYDTMSLILSAEAGAAFDEYTREGLVDGMVRQGRNTWPTTFRAARFIPAVDYINANRVRTLAMQRWAELFRDLDVIVTPTFAPNQLLATNLTGHPAVILPNGFREDGTPVSITFLGGLFGEAPLLAVAHAYQEATVFHRQRPQLPAT